MRLIFPKKIDNTLRLLKIKLLPKTLFFRTMLLIFIPLTVVQVVSIVAYFDGSWGRVGKKLSQNLADNISFVVEIADSKIMPISDLKKLAETQLSLNFEYYSNEEKTNIRNNVKRHNEIITGFLEDSLEIRFPSTVNNIYLVKKNKLLVVLLDTPTGMYKFSTDSKNIFSTSIFGFVIWMVGSSILLFLVAVLFLRIQVRSIQELANAAEEFGKGIDKKGFKPYGSSEVRKAAFAFVKMKERIQKQISERTQMLAGVSHDLRTPLTRMKLQVEMMPEIEDKEDFLQDVSEMEKMLDGYLSFVSGEGLEDVVFVDVNEMIVNVLHKYKNKNVSIRYSTNDSVSAIQGREQALKRAFTNIVSNSFRYAKTISVTLESNSKNLLIVIEDDGPGIAADKREDVFKAFYRIEGSRNKETGGVGLGLSITKDVITSHGGTIDLLDSDLGGLKVLISIPL